MSAKKPSRKLRKDAADSYVDLTSLMDIFTNVLIFLILTAVFIKATSISLNLPQQSANKNTQAKKEKIKILTLKVEDEGLKLGGNLGKKFPYIPLKNGNYQYSMLVENLKKIKTDNPEHSNIVLLIKDSIKYGKIINIMDTTREYFTMVNGKRISTDLFPSASLGEG